MSYEIGTATDHYDLLTKLRTFLESTLPTADRWVVQRGLTATYGNIVSITRASTTATVTTDIPHLLSTGNSVTISGATDSLYNITAAITYVSPTVFTYTLSSAPSADASGTLVLTRNDRQVIWKAPGLSHTEEIYVGLSTYQSIPSDYYNFYVRGFTGYVSDNVFGSQPGISTDIGIPLWNQSIPYWFVANGQRCIVFAKIQNVYNSFYLGKFLPYATPSQYPYPLLVGGMLTSASPTRYDNASYNSWWKGNRVNLAMRFVDGTWKNPQLLIQETVSPNILRNTITLSGTAAGYYGLHPLVLSDTTPNVYGELDGLYMISGFNNAVENTIVVGGVTYVVFRDVYRTGFQDYVALKLE